MSPANRELLAIILGIRKFRYPMHNHTVRPDHSNIRHAFGSTSAVVKRWRFELVGVAIQHIPAISRSAARARAAEKEEGDGPIGPDRLLFPVEPIDDEPENGQATGDDTNQIGTRPLL